MILVLTLCSCGGTPKAVKDYNAAMVLIAEQRYVQAEEILLEYVQTRPYDHEAWNQLGLIAFREKRWSEAERCFREAEDLAPARLIYRRNLALALAEQNQLAQAKEIVSQLVEEDSRNAGYRVNLARILWLLGEQESAREELAKARTLAPENAEVQRLIHEWSPSNRPTQ